MTDEDEHLINKYDDILRPKGFMFEGESWQFDFYREEDIEEVYRGFEIFFDIIRGGIICVDIIHQETDWVWSYTTHPEFGYFDNEGIMNFVKKAIDEVETISFQLPDGIQLSLF